VDEQVREESKKVVEVFESHKKRYGTRRLQVELGRQGYPMSRGKLRRIMQQEGLRAIQPKSFVPRTTQTDPGRLRSPNLLEVADFSIYRPNQVYVGDITYLPVGGKWCYMATWIDAFTRVVKGYCVDNHMETSLVTRALSMAINEHSPGQGLIIHTDGGSQYSSKAFRSVLATNKFEQSMTRKDNHYDNAMAESFFGRMKAELLEKQGFRDCQQAKSLVFEYIHYYNTKRIHSGISNQVPAEYEKGIKQSLPGV
jgi:transposase InsO family protein